MGCKQPMPRDADLLRDVASACLQAVAFITLPWMLVKYKTCHRYNEPGHAHALTFSCYHQLPLLGDDRVKDLFVRSLAAARVRHEFALWAYVVMPNHAHVLLYPRRAEYSVSTILAGLKRPIAYYARPLLRYAVPHFWQ